MSSVRVYGSADLAQLRELAGGESLSLTVQVPASPDEQDEYDALVEAAESGPVVIAAELNSADAEIALPQVQSFHLDADGSGDLAWYAPQELDQVIAILEGAGAAD